MAYRDLDFIRRFKTLSPLMLELVVPRWRRLLLATLLVMASRAAALVVPAATPFLVDDVLIARRSEYLLPIVFAVLGAAAAQAVLSYAMGQVLATDGARLVSEMRHRVQSHVRRLPLASHDLRNPGAFVSRVVNDTESVRNLLGTSLVEFAGRVATAIYATIYLLRLSPTLTSITLAFLAAYGAFSQLRLRWLRPLLRERLAASENLSARLTESEAGIRVVKAYGAEAHEDRAFGVVNTRMLENTLRTIATSSLLGGVAAFAMGLLSVTLMYIGAREVFANALSVGELVTFTAFAAYLTGPMTQFSIIGMMISEAAVGLERTQELLKDVPEDRQPRRTVPIGRLQGHISFEGVSFAYRARSEDPAALVLHDISFDARPDTMTALVGPSGAGKSTIINLLAGFYDPTAGTVRVDGVDLSRVELVSYRRQLGIVLQESFLFDGTIRENVAFARPDASDADVRAACAVAHVDEFARRLPDGYQTRVGDRGVRLSAGQRQRVSIARALLADPRILILDEATSSLDPESEALVHDGLRTLMRGRTTVVIAHRLSTVQRADQILVIDHGRLVERGTHDSLRALGRKYFTMCERLGLTTRDNAAARLAPGAERHQENVIPVLLSP
jgi:ABC-type multidrug transport system fused ATPase/permease subunit